MTEKNLAAEVAAALNPPHPLAHVATKYTEAELPATKGTKRIPLSKLKPSKTNPRQTFVGLEELAKSIESVGDVLVPLIVREVGDHFEIVSGERRFRAAKLAKLETVPCDVREFDDVEVLEVQITENLHRKDLTELEEAEAYESLVKKHGFSAEQIAEKFGTSTGTIYGRLKICDLVAVARTALAEGKLPSSAAVPLARLPEKLQVKALRDAPTDDTGKINARAMIRWLQTEFARSLKSPPFDPKDLTLIGRAGACSACPKNTRCGQPGLFDDFGADSKSGSGFCTDVACFDEKADAAYKLAVEKHRKAGAVIMTKDESATLYPKHLAGRLAYGARFVELDMLNPLAGEGKKITYREDFERLPEGERPPLHIARVDGGPRELVELSALMKSLRATERPAKWVKAEQKASEKASEARAECREETEEIEFRERVVRAALLKAASKAKGANVDLLRFVVRGFTDRMISQTALDALGYGTREKFEKAIARADLAEVLRALVMFGAYAGDLIDCGDGYPAEIRPFLAAYQVDLKAIEKATRDGDKAESVKAEKGGK